MDKYHSSSKRKWFQNIKVKLFSALSAMLIWFFVVTDNYYEYTVDIPIYLNNRPPGWILTESIQDKAKVKFRGTGKSLLSLAYSNKRIVLDLQGESRTRTFHLNIGMIKGIRVNESLVPLRVLSPDSINIRLDRYAEGKFPIVSQLTMKPSDGYTQVGTVFFQPDSIIVGGPAVLIRNLQSVRTIEREVAHLIKPLTDDIILEPPSVSTISYEKDKVEFSVDVQRIGEKVIDRIPIQLVNVPIGITVNVVPSTMSVTLQGGVDLLSSIDADQISATIDYEHRDRYGDQKMPATIKLPPGINFSNVKPQFFELIIHR